MRRARTNDGQTNKMILVSRQLMSPVSCLALIEMTSLHELNPLHQHQLQAKRNGGSHTTFFRDVLFPLVLSSPRARSGANSSFVSQLPEHSMTGAVWHGPKMRCIARHWMHVASWGSTNDEGSQLFGCGLRSVI